MYYVWFKARCRVEILIWNTGGLSLQSSLHSQVIYEVNQSALMKLDQRKSLMKLELVCVRKIIGEKEYLRDIKRVYYNCR